MSRLGRAAGLVGLVMVFGCEDDTMLSLPPPSLTTGAITIGASGGFEAGGDTTATSSTDSDTGTTGPGTAGTGPTETSGGTETMGTITGTGGGTETTGTGGGTGPGTGGTATGSETGGLPCMSVCDCPAGEACMAGQCEFAPAPPLCCTAPRCRSGEPCELSDGSPGLCP